MRLYVTATPTLTTSKSGEVNMASLEAEQEDKPRKFPEPQETSQKYGIMAHMNRRLVQMENMIQHMREDITQYAGQEQDKVEGITPRFFIGQRVTCLTPINDEEDEWVPGIVIGHHWLVPEKGKHMPYQIFVPKYMTLIYAEVDKESCIREFNACEWENYDPNLGHSFCDLGNMGKHIAEQEHEKRPGTEE